MSLLKTKLILERRGWPQLSFSSIMMIDGGHRHLLEYSILLTARLSSEARDYRSMTRCRCYRVPWMLFTIHEEDVEVEALSLTYCIAVLIRVSDPRSLAWPKRSSTRLSCPRTLKRGEQHTQDLVRAKTTTGSIFTKTIFKGSNIKTNSERLDTFHRVSLRKRHSRKSLRTICTKWMRRKSKSKKK